MSLRGKIFLIFLVLAALAVGGIAFLRSGDESAEPEAASSPTPVSTAGSLEVSPTIVDETETPQPQSSPTQRRDSAAWDGPDNAVTTFFSQNCNREVLQYGAQQYSPGTQTSSVPPDVEYMGYSSGKKQLWGDRGAPSVLYVTEDGGKTFLQWEASDEGC